MRRGAGGYWLLVIGYWLLVIGYWLLVPGHWLFVIGHSSLVSDPQSAGLVSVSSASSMLRNYPAPNSPTAPHRPHHAPTHALKSRDCGTAARCSAVPSRLFARADVRGQKTEDRGQPETTFDFSRPEYQSSQHRGRRAHRGQAQGRVRPTVFVAYAARRLAPVEPNPSRPSSVSSATSVLKIYPAPNLPTAASPPPRAHPCREVPRLRDLRAMQRGAESPVRKGHWPAQSEWRR
jgi:hypothetical protein